MAGLGREHGIVVFFHSFILLYHRAAEYNLKQNPDKPKA